MGDPSRVQYVEGDQIKYAPLHIPSTAHRNILRGHLRLRSLNVEHGNLHPTGDPTEPVAESTSITPKPEGRFMRIYRLEWAFLSEEKHYRSHAQPCSESATTRRVGHRSKISGSKRGSE